MSTTVQPIGAEHPVAPVGTYTGTGNGEQLSSPAMKAENAKLAPEKINAVVKELNDAMRIISTSLSFSIDEATGKTVIRVIDDGTKQVIRQIPSEDVLNVAARITELLGVLFDEKR